MEEANTPNMGYPRGAPRELQRLRWWECRSAADILVYVARNLRIAPSLTATHVVYLEVSSILGLVASRTTFP